MYPNPTNNLLNIESEGNENAIKTVEVFDFYGKMMYSFSPKSDYLNIDMSGLTKGMYIIRINTAIVNRIVVF